jgi:hypothetical protein
VVWTIFEKLSASISLHLDDRYSKILQNFGKFLPDDMALQPRRGLFWDLKYLGSLTQNIAENVDPTE